MTIDLLENRTWRDLRATARMYGVYFENLWTREEALTGLRQTLLEEKHVPRAIQGSARAACRGD